MTSVGKFKFRPNRSVLAGLQKHVLEAFPGKAGWTYESCTSSWPTLYAGISWNSSRSLWLWVEMSMFIKYEIWDGNSKFNGQAAPDSPRSKQTANQVHSNNNCSQTSIAGPNSFSLAVILWELAKGSDPVETITFHFHCKYSKWGFESMKRDKGGGILLTFGSVSNMIALSKNFLSEIIWPPCRGRYAEVKRWSLEMEIYISASC